MTQINMRVCLNAVRSRNARLEDPEGVHRGIRDTIRVVGGNQIQQ